MFIIMKHCLFGEEFRIATIGVGNAWLTHVYFMFKFQIDFSNALQTYPYLIGRNKLLQFQKH